MAEVKVTTGPIEFEHMSTQNALDTLKDNADDLDLSQRIYAGLFVHNLPVGDDQLVEALVHEKVLREHYDELHDLFMCDDMSVTLEAYDEAEVAWQDAEFALIAEYADAAERLVEKTKCDCSFAHCRSCGRCNGCGERTSCDCPPGRVVLATS